MAHLHVSNLIWYDSFTSTQESEDNTNEQRRALVELGEHKEKEIALRAAHAEHRESDV